ncbi:uncharacterized protein MONBRDRAFT_6700 [Monosiga brevicollis MX1]|uniref:RecQ mediated genome instability protein 1 OB-fold domain-containing protein n=1 Tax=Monosiga brevicollis TaxID=81824 RepID=A9UV14_MONBE|nr:uncharacterized protein MONBRDRAFT_6700 [Monosiga brevicollis MX1]EDQ90811.1 predicted protein [Monosiga brevicollis MX1]|eukprot:XP_001744108.1 hypothetical protein [Monosiga brevicollis MX1]
MSSSWGKIQARAKDVAACDIWTAGYAFWGCDEQRSYIIVTAALLLSMPQVVSVSNASAPAINQDSQGAPRMLKVVLTDGKRKFTGVESAPLSALSRKTNPGTKILLTESNLPIFNNIVLLNPSNCRVLGGHVPELVERWAMQVKLAEHQRSHAVRDASYPVFLPFSAANLKALKTSKTPQAKPAVADVTEDSTKGDSRDDRERLSTTQDSKHVIKSLQQATTSLESLKLQHEAKQEARREARMQKRRGRRRHGDDEVFEDDPNTITLEQLQQRRAQQQQLPKQGSVPSPAQEGAQPGSTRPSAEVVAWRQQLAGMGFAADSIATALATCDTFDACLESLLQGLAGQADQAHPSAQVTSHGRADRASDLTRGTNQRREERPQGHERANATHKGAKHGSRSEGAAEPTARSNDSRRSTSARGHKDRRQTKTQDQQGSRPKRHDPSARQEATERSNTRHATQAQYQPPASRTQTTHSSGSKRQQQQQQQQQLPAPSQSLKPSHTGASKEKGKHAKQAARHANSAVASAPQLPAPALTLPSPSPAVVVQLRDGSSGPSDDGLSLGRPLSASGRGRSRGAKAEGRGGRGRGGSSRRSVRQ